MKRCVCCIKDEVVGLYNTPMVFENEDIAYVSVRRWTRDAYERGDVTLDQLKEQSLVMVGQFDTETGAMLSFDEKDYEVIAMDKFIDEVRNEI